MHKNFKIPFRYLNILKKSAPQVRRPRPVLNPGALPNVNRLVRPPRTTLLS
jgi:hypothetical protein